MRTEDHGPGKGRSLLWYVGALLCFAASFAVAVYAAPKLRARWAGRGAADVLRLYDVSSLEANYNGPYAAVVRFGGSEWIVIGYRGGGVASETADGGTVTLLSRYADGRECFDRAGKSNVYVASDLRTYLEDIYNSDLVSGPERDAIRPRKLLTGSYLSGDGDGCDGIAGYEVNRAYLWTLSVKEAQHLAPGLLASGDWWLRSPGYKDDFAGYVSGSGVVFSAGTSVGKRLGVRPAVALRLDAIRGVLKLSDGSFRPVLENDRVFVEGPLLEMIRKDEEAVISFSGVNGDADGIMVAAVPADTDTDRLPEEGREVSWYPLSKCRDHRIIYPLPGEYRGKTPGVDFALVLAPVKESSGNGAYSAGSFIEVDVP